MKKRFLTAIPIGLLAAGVGFWVAHDQNQQGNMLAIVVATGVIGFMFGLLFKIRGL